MQRKIVWAILILCGSGLFGYVLYRALHLSLVHDEGLSFTIIQGDPTWKATANHHPLNTRLMLWAYRILGQKEWELRLPNVISYILYLTAGLLLLRRLKSVWTIGLGFAVLNLNPFLLDFFGLARGYGLASGLSLTSLLLFVEAWHAFQPITVAIFLFLAFVFAALADLGNYAWVNFHLAMLTGAMIVLFSNRHPIRLGFKPRIILFSVFLLVANGWFLYNLTQRILILQQTGQLYSGATTFSESANSLIQMSLYTASNQNSAIGYVLWTLFGVLSIIGIYLLWRLIRDRRLEVSTVLYTILLLSVIAPIAEHRLFGSLYPADRSNLVYVPLLGLAVVFSLDTMNRWIIRGFSSACTILMIIHFANSANLRYTLIWHYDADTKEAMQELEKRFATSSARIRIGNSWQLEPSINYYRASRHYAWLDPATRMGTASGEEYDALLCFPAEVPKQELHYVSIVNYPESGTVLFLKKP